MMSTLRFVFTALVCSVLGLSLQARDWVLTDGTKVSGDFAGQAGNFIFVKEADGRRTKVAMDLLSASDKQYVKDLRRGAPTEAKVDAPAAAATEKKGNPSGSRSQAAFLGHKLVRLGGNGFTPAMSADKPQYYALYYSAGWCPPCNRFTPKLVSFYNQHRAAHPNFEVIFVSSDEDESAMAAYMRKYSMPWPAFRHADGRSSSVQQYSGRGIPCLVVMDANGKVLAHSYENGNYVGPERPMHKLGQLLKDR